MAQQIINIGTSPNDGLGDSIRTAFGKTNTNFSDLYSFFQTSPPPTLRGSIGDHAGMIANDANYFYYCFANFDGSSTIWAQIAQVGNVVLPSISNGTSNVVVSPSGNVSIAVTGIPDVGVFGTTGLSVLNDISATGNVLGANITAISTVRAGAISASGDISAAGNIAGNYLFGNGSQLTGITPDYGNANVAAFLPTYTGNITANWMSAAGNVTGAYILGNGSQLTGLPATYDNANVADFLPTYTGNLVSLGGDVRTLGAVSATGNISGSYILGNGSRLTGLPSTYTDANVAAFLPTYTGNLASMSGIITTSANVTGGNLRTAGQVSATGNITGAYILGNGSQLTGLPATYSDANVAAFLPTYTGNLVSLSGDVNTTGNITGAYILGNAAFLSGLPATYSNANVSAYLPTYTGNLNSLTGPVRTSANITGGNLSINNQISAFGNITGRYFIGDGSQLTGLASDYSNTNVAAFLPTYSGNLGANNVNVSSSISVAGAIMGNVTGLVNGLDIRYLSFDFGFVDTTTPYTNPIQYLLAYTGAGNIDMGSISAPSALNIDAGGTMQ